MQFEDLKSELNAANAEVENAKRCKEVEEQELKGIEVQLFMTEASVQTLEVLKNGGEWVNVKPLFDAILVLLADQTEIITNGKYGSCVHRAITNPDRARLSVATFHDPAKTVEISPASELVNESSPAKYRDVVYGDYLSSWYTKGPEGK